MKLYYSISDTYPAYRVDIAELFGEELKQLGLEIEWYMNRGKDTGAHGSIYKDQVVHLPAGGKHLPASLARLGYVAADIRYLLSQRACPPDALQCRDKYLAPLFAILVARLTGVPFFYWCSYPFPEHDRLMAEMEPARWRRLLQSAKAAVRFYLLYKVICPASSHVFVQSARMLEDMQRYGIPAANMTVVPMGASKRLLNWASRNRVAVIPARVVYLGTLAKVRRLDLVLEAFRLVKKHVPDAQLFFIGEGDHASEREDLERRARALEIQESVQFTGFLPMDEAWRLTASAAVCLSPFYPTDVLLSTSPTKLIEYLALGRPVVCNHHPEQSEIITASGAGICVGWSAEEFAAAIEYLISSPMVAEQMAANGPRWVRENRAYPKIAMQVWRKYQDLVQKVRR